jgi:hypothetical protein
MEQKLGPSLRRRIGTAGPDERLEVHILLRRGWELPLGDAAPNRATVIWLAKENADRSQSRFLADLRMAFAAQLGDGDLGPPQFTHTGSYWINNVILAEVSRDSLELIQRHSEVEYVELKTSAELKELFGPTLEPALRPPVESRVRAGVAWQVNTVEAPALWRLGLKGRGVIVAVLDSGVNYRHPDLERRMWNGGPDFPHHGYDFVGHGDSDPLDEDGHGTATAGIIAGDGGTSGTITGVAPEATIMALRAGDTEQSFWAGLQFALDHGADVISLAVTWKNSKRPNYPGWRRACELVLAAGLLHANSSGNDRDLLDDELFKIPYNIGAPGNCPPPWLHSLQMPGGRSSAVSCGATYHDDVLFEESGCGPVEWSHDPYQDYLYRNGTLPGLIKPDLCAPGPQAYTCDYRFGLAPDAPRYSDDRFGGTSAATANVAGCMALLVQAARDARQPVLPARIQEALESRALRIDGQRAPKENHFGSGRVDVAAAHKFGRDKGWW